MERNGVWGYRAAKASRFIGVVIAALALASCTSSPRPPAYKPPDLPPDATARITESELQDGGFLTQNTHAGIAQIDGSPLQDQPPSAVVTPGLHKVMLIASQKQFGGEARGSTEVQLDAKACMNYVVHMTKPVGAGGNCKTANIWIEDRDGTVVTDKALVGIVLYTGEYGMPAGGILNSLIKTPCNS
jgi:hypothetical protein